MFVINWIEHIWLICINGCFLELWFRSIVYACSRCRIFCMNAAFESISDLHLHLYFLYVFVFRRHAKVIVVGPHFLRRLRIELFLILLFEFSIFINFIDIHRAALGVSSLKVVLVLR